MNITESSYLFDRFHNKIHVRKINVIMNFKQILVFQRGALSFRNNQITLYLLASNVKIENIVELHEISL